MRARKVGPLLYALLDTVTDKPGAVRFVVSHELDCSSLEETPGECDCLPKLEMDDDV